MSCPSHFLGNDTTSLYNLLVLDEKRPRLLEAGSGAEVIRSDAGEKNRRFFAAFPSENWVALSRKVEGGKKNAGFFTGI